MEIKAEDHEGLSQAMRKTPEEEPKETVPIPTPTPPKDATPTNSAPVEFPDPDEDDLEDLDGLCSMSHHPGFPYKSLSNTKNTDLLDEFIPPKTEPAPPSIPSGPGRPETTSAPSIEGLSDDDFEKQLQATMAQLMGDADSTPDMQATFESLMKEFVGATGGAAVAEPSIAPEAASGSAVKAKAKDTKGAKSKSAKEEESFQETIKKTMERMQASGASATAAAGSAADNSDDLLAEMMKAMQGMDGEGGEEDFSKMLMGMMEQLTNKEILYEPMKELHDKFPEWMEKNAKTTPEEDLKRYREQQVYVKEIVERFERKGYTDENVQDREYIVERMQKVCYSCLLKWRVIWLISYRCKLLDRRLQTLLEIRQLHKKHSAHPKRDVHSNEANLISNSSHISALMLVYVILTYRLSPGAIHTSTYLTTFLNADANMQTIIHQ